jgi:hypothetical protein
MSSGGRNNSRGRDGGSMMSGLANFVVVATCGSGHPARVSPRV